jgi:hypothetical protein
VVLELDTARQGLVNRATLGDLCETFPLRFVEVALDMNVAGDLFDEAFLWYVAVFAIVSVDA